MPRGFLWKIKYGLVCNADLLTCLEKEEEEIVMDIPLLLSPFVAYIFDRIHDKVQASSTKELVLVDAPRFDRRDRTLEA